MTAQGLLKGSSSRLSLWGSIASTPVGLGAVYYALETLQLPDAAITPLLVIVGILIVVLSTATTQLYKRQLAPLHAVESGKINADEDALANVATAVAAMPDFVFKLNSISWIGAAAFVLVGLKLSVPQIDPPLMVRLGVCALAFYPVGALLAFILVSQEVRRVIMKLPAAGLSPDRLAKSVPRSKIRVRTRLIVFTAILVVVPSAVIADLSMAVLRRGMDAVQQEQDPKVQAELADKAVRDAIRAIAILGSAVVVFALITAWAGGTALSSPMRALAREAKRMREGNFSSSSIVAAEDELWDVAMAFTTVRAQIISGLTELRRAGLQMSTTADQLHGMAERHVAGATDQAGALQQTSVTTEELARVATQIAESATGVAGRAGETLEAARAGQQRTSAFEVSMKALEGDHKKIAGAVAELERRALLIRGLVGFIASVADRTDLLALNADLEGTKAGDAGRGFSLVAAEMRRLGEEVAKSTRQIQGLIEEVREATAQALRATEAGAKTTRTGNELARRVSEVLARIVSFAEDTTRSAAQISSATSQQQSSSAQLAEAMARVLQVTQDNRQGQGTLEASTTDLVALARELKDVVQRFRMPGAQP